MQKTLRSLSCLPTIFTPQLPFCRIHQVPGHIHTFLWFSSLPPPSGQLCCQVGLTDKFYKRGIASLDNPPHPFVVLLVVFSYSSHLECWNDGRSYSSHFVTSHGCSAAQSCPLGLRCSVLPTSPATAWNVPGFSAHGISLARILEWVATPSSRGSFWPRDWTHISSGYSALSGTFFTTSSPWEAWQAPKEKQKQKEKKKEAVERPAQRLWASAPVCAAYLQDSYYPRETEKSQEALSCGLHRLPGTCTQNTWNSRTKTPDTGSSHRKGEIWIP